MFSYLKFTVAVLIFTVFSATCLWSYQNNFFIPTPEEKTLIANPPDTTEAFELGQYYFNHGDNADGTYDLVKARAYFTQALEENPEGNVLAWHQLGRIDFLEGKFADAIYKFNQQIKYFGVELPNVYYMLGLTYGYQARASGSEVSWQKASENFLKYLEFDPTSPWARVDLSWIYFAQGKYELMLPVLEVGLVHHPANPWLLNMYGLALMNTGDKAKAHQYFLWAKDEATKLTVEDWGQSYPGNDPNVWGQGLAEFQAIIEKNLDLTSR